MACLIRKGDTAEFVPRGDTAARQDGIAAPDADWLLADGQPAECQRVRVRALSADEQIALPPGADGVKYAATHGFKALNGEAIPLDDLDTPWQLAIGFLVLAVTRNPLIGRPFWWMASQSPGQTTQTPSPESNSTSPQSETTDSTAASAGG